jgi:hypothetical protein
MSPEKFEPAIPASERPQPHPLTPRGHRNWLFLCFLYDRYTVYLLQLGFHPVAVVGKIVQKQDTAQKEKQYTKQYKNTEYAKYKRNIQRT